MKEGEKAASVWLVEAGKWKSTKLDGRQTTRPRDPGRARRGGQAATALPTDTTATATTTDKKVCVVFDSSTPLPTDRPSFLLPSLPQPPDWQGGRASEQPQPGPPSETPGNLNLATTIEIVCY